MTRRTLWIALLGLVVISVAGVAVRLSGAFDKEIDDGFYLNRLYGRLTEALREDPDASIEDTLADEWAEIRRTRWGDPRRHGTLQIYYNDAVVDWIGEGGNARAVLLMAEPEQVVRGRRGFRAHWHGGGRLLTADEARQERDRLRLLPTR